MQRTLLGKLAILLVLVGALALAGCGGDSGLSAEDQARIADAEAEAERQREAAEEAERQRQAEAEAKAEAERERQAAEAEAERQRQAERDRMAAEEQAETERLEAIRMALSAIAAAATAELADAAYAAVVGQATFAEGQQLMEAVANRKTALATMARADAQKMALSDAAGMVDTSDLMTQAAIDAATSAIAALEMALTGAADVSEADKAMYVSQLAAAKADVGTAQSALDHATQMMALNDAVAALAAVNLGDLDTQAKIDAANMAIMALQAALDGGTDLMDAEKAAARTNMMAANGIVMAAQATLDMNTADSQKMGLMDAVTALGEIDLTDLSTQDKIDAANMAVMALQAALDAATSLSDADKREATTDLGNAQRRVTAAQTMLDDNIDGQRMALTNAGTALGEMDLGLDDLSDQDAVNAAKYAVAALKTALDGATHLSDADKAMYQTQHDTANMAVMAAQTALDRAAQMMVLNSAVTALQAVDFTGLTTQGAIDAAETAIANLQMAMDDATDLTDAEKSAAMIELAAAARTVLLAQGRVDIAAQMTALTTAIEALHELNIYGDGALMTQEDIDAARRALARLELALDNATDLTDEQKLDAIVDLSNSMYRVDDAQATLDDNVDDQRKMLSAARKALEAIDIDDLDTQPKIDAAQSALDDLKAALEGATHLSDAEKADAQALLDGDTEKVRMARTGMDETDRMRTQRTAITGAVTAARAAVNAVNNTATDDQVTAADDALTALQAAIDGAEDLPEGDADVANAQGTLDTLKDSLANAKTSRMAAMDAADRQRNEANELTATKLFEGIYAPADDDAGTDVGDVHAAYNDTDTAIVVTIGDGTAVANVETLSEDKKATVSANHGWEGKRYTRTVPVPRTGPAIGVGDTYVAVVYSNVEPPTMGKMFGAGDDPEYTLTDGMFTIDAATTDAHAARVAGPSFDQTAGVKQFKLPRLQTGVEIPGSFHGVSGTYTCTPTDSTVTCATDKAAKGFTLGLRTNADGSFDASDTAWTFKPSSLSARVTDAEDEDYASYGWWLKKSRDGQVFTASVFLGDVGEVPDAVGLDDLNGKATYRGGAAGKYSLSSSTGGRNDAGHFTAKATLEADFTNNTAATAITGTIDEFKVGDAGEMRDWTVKLNGSPIADTGGIGDGSDITPNNGPKTVWTVDGVAGAPAGHWTGSLRDTEARGGDISGVPKVATGTFYTEYSVRLGSVEGKMVGAFGANK